MAQLLECAYCCALLTAERMALHNLLHEQPSRAESSSELGSGVKRWVKARRLHEPSRMSCNRCRAKRI